MTTIARALKENSPAIYPALLLALGALLVLSPAEATLGNVVKIVYAHAAAERVSTYAYLLAGALGLGHLLLQRPALARWTQAVAEMGIAFWVAQIVISLPAQILAWGALSRNEPRVAGAMWILALTTLVYVVARWIGDAGWMSLGAVANAAIVIIVLQGAINILHPIDPIIASDSPAIKAFYVAIVLVTGTLAILIARERARRI